MFHPVEPRLVLSANAKEGAALWDVRMPKKYVNFGNLHCYSHLCDLLNVVAL